MTKELGPLDGIIDHYTKFANDNLHNVEASFSDEYEVSVRRRIDRALGLCGCNTISKILDLACGTGRHTVEIARRGHDVVGLDCTPRMIEVAHEVAERVNAKVKWELADMRVPRYKDEFDYVLLRDVIFGVCETDEENLTIIRNMARAVKPGGRCILEAYNKDFAMLYGIEDFLYFDEQTGRFACRDKNETQLTLKLYPHEEFETMFAACGLKIVTKDQWTWPGDPEPPPPRADIFVLEKPR